MTPVDQIIGEAVSRMGIEGTERQRAALRELLVVAYQASEARVEEARRAELERCVRAARRVMGVEASRALHAVLAGGGR